MIEQIASLIHAIASLAWPSLGIVVALLFRKEIRSLAGRLKKGKFLGQELELADLQKLEEGAQAALKLLPGGASVQRRALTPRRWADQES